MTQQHLARRDDPVALTRPADAPPSDSPAAWRPPQGILGIVRRHLLLIIVCALLAGAAAAAATTRIAPTFVSTATIRIDQKSSQLPALDALGLWQGNALATEIGILRSRALAEEVIDSLALQLVVHRPAAMPRAAVFSYIRVDRAAPAVAYRLVAGPAGTFTLLDRTREKSIATVRRGERFERDGLAFELAPSAPRQGAVDFDVVTFRKAIETFQTSLDVSRRDKDADLADVTYRGPDAALTSQVVNLLSRRFIGGRQDERHAEARTMVRFLGDQIQRVADQLAASEQALRSFREREHVISLEDEASTGVSRQAELRAQRNSLEAERASLARLLAAARRERGPAADARYRDLLAFPTLLRSGAAATMLAPLTAAEGQRNELLGRRTREDPDVQLLDGRIAQLHGQIASLVNTYQEGLTSQVAALDTILARSDAALQAIPSKEIELAELERDAKTSETIYSMLQTRLEEAQIAEAASDPSVRLLDPALVPLKPVAPRPLLNVALALVAGGLAGLAGGTLRELSDRSVRTRRELLAAAGVPVVGVVPHSRPARRLFALGRRTPEQRNEPTTVQAFSWLATNLVFVRPSAPMRTLVITSALPGDGKTTVATNLATTLARHGRRVLLVDADLRGGRVAQALGVRAEPGLSETLAGQLSAELAVQRVELPNGSQLSVITAGAIAPHPTQLLASHRVRELLQWAMEHHDITIVDSPPTNVAADAALIAPRCDGVLLVARAGVTERGAVALAMEQLAMVRAPIVGAVLNDVDLRRDRGYDVPHPYVEGQHAAHAAERVMAEREGEQLAAT